MLRLSRLGWVVVRWLDKLFVRIKRPPLMTKVSDFRIHGFLRDFRYLRLLSEQRFEPFSLKLARENLAEGDAFVDGGAHLGLFSVLASRIVGESGSVLSFEPDPMNFAALTYNLTVNRCRNASAKCEALSDRAGIAVFYKGFSSLSGSLINRSDVLSLGISTVNTVTIDQCLAPKFPKRLFVKLDIEGAEPLAIRGMLDSVRNANKVCLLAEFSPVALADGGLSRDDYIRQLNKLFTNVYVVDESQQALRPLPKVRDLNKGNLFAVVKRA